MSRISPTDTQDLEVRFRVSRGAAEIWHPYTGAIEPAGYTITGDRTVVPFSLNGPTNPSSSFFVHARAAPRSDCAPNIGPLATIDGAWDVSFPPEAGAPATRALAGRIVDGSAG